MQDRLKFRAVFKNDRFVIIVPVDAVFETGYQIDTNIAQKIFENKYPNKCFFSDFLEIIEKQEYISQYSFDCDLLITKDFTNLMQCTGLKDNIKWCNLSLKEKQDFYNQVCREDGETIKYHKIEDVEHLWKGKLIFEGDILKVNTGSRDTSGYGVVEYAQHGCNFVVNGFLENPSGFYPRRKGEFFLPLQEWLCTEIIGNIYENPELLGETNDKI